MLGNHQTRPHPGSKCQAGQLKQADKGRTIPDLKNAWKYLPEGAALSPSERRDAEELGLITPWGTGHQGVRAARPWGRGRAGGAWPEPVGALVCLTAWPDGDNEGGLSDPPFSQFGGLEGLRSGWRPMRPSKYLSV